MNRKRRGPKTEIRYSEAFKRAAVFEVERGEKTYAEVQHKYGVRSSATVPAWVRKYGNGSRGKVIRVEKPEEINELRELRQRVRRLESALADANIDLAMERAYTQIACEQAGIEDVAEFKKKADMPRRTRP